MATNGHLTGYDSCEQHKKCVHSRRFFKYQWDSETERELLEQRARREINEVPDKRQEEIAKLRELLSQENQEWQNRSDDSSFLLKYLRASKFNQKDAAKMIQSYFREHDPVFHKKLIPSRAMDVLEARIFFALPHLGPDGRAILLIRCEMWDPSKFTLEDVLTALFVAVEVMAEEERCQICGINIICDGKGFHTGHVAHYTPDAVHKLVAFLQDWSPVRIENIFYVRHHGHFDDAFKLCQPLIRNSIMEKLHFLGPDLKALHERFPRQILPEWLGGSYVTDEDETKKWIEYVLDKEAVRENSSMQVV